MQHLNYNILYKRVLTLFLKRENPAGIKSVFEALGLSTAVVRLPLVEASNNLKSKIQEFIKSYTGLRV